MRFRDVTGGAQLYGFPPPQLLPRLRWLGADYSALLARDLGQGLLRQAPGTRLRAVRCESDPMVRTVGVDHAGVPRAQDVSFALEVLLLDEAGRSWRLRGRWTYTGRELGTPQARVNHYWELFTVDRV
ncbi:hypothetical protein ABGB12_14820 [Actinocorallia sp. B10E7]|uniref:hypothetical protein n=1 Tax=Actinocorallia sp. B10E7 TaxID=3153558 RepID=UPI00325F677B